MADLKLRPAPPLESPRLLRTLVSAFITTSFAFCFHAAKVGSCVRRNVFGERLVVAAATVWLLAAVSKAQLPSAVFDACCVQLS